MKFFPGSGGSGGGGGGGGGGLFPALTVPLAAAFTSTIGTGVTVTDKTERMVCTAGSPAVAVKAILQNSIATPYTIDLCVGLMTNQIASSEATLVGISLSDGTKYISLEYGMNSPSGSANQGFPVVAVRKWNTTVSQASVAIVQALTIPHNQFGLRVTDSGTTRSYYISSNGKDFYFLASEATNTFLTPTKFGISFYNALTGVTLLAPVYGYLVSDSVLPDAP